MSLPLHMSNECSNFPRFALRGAAGLSFPARIH